MKHAIYGFGFAAAEEIRVASPKIKKAWYFA